MSAAFQKAVREGEHASEIAVPDGSKGVRIIVDRSSFTGTAKSDGCWIRMESLHKGVWNPRGGFRIASGDVGRLESSKPWPLMGAERLRIKIDCKESLNIGVTAEFF